jgi:hypothetical protein
MVTQSESLRHDESTEMVRADDREPPCFTVRQDDSSRNVTEKRADYTGSGIPRTSDEAIHLAIKLALDAGNYDGASALLDVLRCMRS